MTPRAWLPERELYMETVLMLAGPEYLSPPETDRFWKGGWAAIRRGLVQLGVAEGLGGGGWSRPWKGG